MFLSCIHSSESGNNNIMLTHLLVGLSSFSISYNPLKDNGLGTMKPGLLKCLNLKILGYVNMYTHSHMHAHTYMNTYTPCRLRGTHMSEGSGVHLKEIFETLPKLELAE